MTDFHYRAYFAWGRRDRLHHVSIDQRYLIWASWPVSLRDAVEQAWTAGWDSVQ